MRYLDLNLSNFNKNSKKNVSLIALSIYMDLSMEATMHSALGQNTIFLVMLSSVSIHSLVTCSRVIACFIVIASAL